MGSFSAEELRALQQTSEDARLLLDDNKDSKSFIEIATQSFGKRALLNQSSFYSNNSPVLHGSLGIKLLVWFLVHSLVRCLTSTKVTVFPVVVGKSLNAALADMANLISAGKQNWCDVRYSIRVIHRIHDAVLALLDDLASKTDYIKHLEAEVVRFQKLNEDLSSRAASIVGSTVRVRMTGDKEKAIGILQGLLARGLIVRYSPDDSRAKSKRHGPVEDCGPQFYVNTVVRPKLVEAGIGQMTDDLSIYRSTMPELYNPLRVFRQRRAKEISQRENVTVRLDQVAAVA